MQRLTIAIAGNPNCGKTTLFNALTGSKAHVANYAGVTVDLALGRRSYQGRDIEFVDLPGTYSLTAFSSEEQIAHRFLTEQKPDVVVIVVDASNLERHLYLALQIAELGVPRVLAFSMADIARSHGIIYDTDRLGAFMGAPIVETVATRGEGIDSLLEAIVNQAELGTEAATPLQVPYGDEIDDAVSAVLESLSSYAPEKLPEAPHRRRLLALQLLEQIPDAVARFDHPQIRETLEKERRRVQATLRDSPEVAVASRRYGFIAGARTETRQTTAESRHARSDCIDRVALAPGLGPLVLLGLMYLVFWLTFTLGAWPQELLETFFDEWLPTRISALWPPGSDSLLLDLLVNGIVAGVGGVLEFLPNIVFLFLGIAILEDSGYMARAAFLMDNVMHRIGLHGKSFIPMLIGFGCTVPAIMATRTLDTRRDRLTTMLVLPFVSCGARFAVYAMLIPAFFVKQWQAPVMMLLYLFGVLLAIGSARVLRKTILRGESMPFVMELPPYRLPTIRGCVVHMWRRTREYIVKAGTIVMAFSVIMWFLSAFPRASVKANEAPRTAAVAETAIPEEAAIPTEEVAANYEGETAMRTLPYAVRIGNLLEPVIRPMGFDRKIATALIGSFAGKELLISQLGVAFAMEDVSPDDPEEDAERSAGSLPLQQTLREHYSPLVGFCLLLFTMLSAPCLATFAVTWRESGQLRWAMIQTAMLTIAAFVITTIVYQVGLGLGF